MEERFDGFLNGLQHRFEEWLTEFEAHPIRAGLKVMIVFIVLRWAWRTLK